MLLLLGAAGATPAAFVASAPEGTGRFTDTLTWAGAQGTRADGVPALDRGSDLGSAGSAPGTAPSWAAADLDGLVPAEAWGTPAPADLAAVMGRVLPPGDRLALPTPDASAPLPAAVATLAGHMGVPVPQLATTLAGVQRLGLSPDGEQALAMLMLAYGQATVLRREATAGLTPEERSLLAMEPPAVSAWLSRNGGDWAAYEAAMVALAARTDQHKSLQAADLLARAADAARVPLASAPSTVLPPLPATLADAAAAAGSQAPGPALLAPGQGEGEHPHAQGAGVAAHLLLAPGPFGPASPQPLAVPDATLEQAWGALRAAAGLPAPPAGALDRVPPSLAAALAPIVAAKVAGMAAGDPEAEALAVLAHARAAAPVADAWGAVGRLAAQQPERFTPAHDGAPRTLLPPATAAARFESRLDQALAGQPAHHRDAVLAGPHVATLLHADRWTPQDAALVRDWAQAHLAMDEAARAGLFDTARAAVVAGLAACPAVASCPWLPLAAAEGPMGLPVSPTTAAGPDLPLNGLLVEDAALTAPSTLCWAPRDACEAPASLLRIGGSDTNAYGHPALVHIDLGGSDTYTSEVAGLARFALRQPPAALPPPTCPPPSQLGLTEPCAPPRPCVAATQDTLCVPSGLGRGSHAIDYGGDDTYDSPGIDGTQGSAAVAEEVLRATASSIVQSSVRDTDHLANRAAASVLLDLAGNDVYFAGNRSQGTASDGGVGILADDAGDDTYRAGNASQATVVTIGLASSGVGLLLDREGDDHYRFVRQASLLGSNGLAVLHDGGGADEYHSAGIAADPRFLASTPDPAFATQGFLGANETGIAALGVAMFLDLGPQRDTFLTLDPQGGTADVTATKQGARRQNTDGSSLGVGLFVDGAPLDPDDLRDHDDDGTPSIAEDFGEAPSQYPLGSRTARDDPARSWGSLPWAATHPGQPGSEGAGMGGPGPWFAPPRVNTTSPAGVLFMPGVLVGGRGNDAYTQWVPFLVDLGGDDAYTAPNVGGIVPMVAGHGVSSFHRTGAPLLNRDVPPTDVALVLDVGATPQGQDLYAPDPAACTFAPAQGTTSYGSRPGDGSVLQGNNAPGTVYAFPAACPSLGGALNGIAVLADDGGRNVFRSALAINVTVRTPQSPPGCGAPRCFIAQVAGYGVTQGAGLFDGIGILATWEASNDFASDVRVEARETGSLEQGVHAPQARAAGVAQGAGFGGTGILASFGAGDDTYTSTVTAVAPQIPTGDAGTIEGASQAAGLSGTGVLLDEGGTNAFASLGGSSQAFASGLDLPTNTLAGGAPGGLGLGQLARPSTALLWAGPGKDTFTAGPFSQGAAVGHRSPLFWTAQPQQPNAGTTAVATLVDAGGSDDYRLLPFAGLLVLSCPQASPTACLLGQGAGALHGVGALVDTGGDDDYSAGNGSHAQGVGIHGTGVLLDREGHDIRRAGPLSQGYGAHVLVVGLQPENQTTTLTTPLLRIADAAPSVGLLLDAEGWDVHHAQAPAQGAATVLVHDAAQATACLATTVLSLVFGNACAGPTQVCAAVDAQQGTTSYRNDLCGGNPCSTTANIRQCESPGQQCLSAPGATPPCIPTSTRLPCTDPCPTLAIGAFLDGAGQDMYDGDIAHCPLADLECTPVPDPNGLTWMDDGGSPMAIGLGSDQKTMDLARAALEDALLDASAPPLPVRVRVDVARDAAGTDPLGTQPAEDDVHLVATVELGGGLRPQDVQRVDFLVDGRLLGAGQRVDGGLRFTLPWRTATDTDTAQSQGVSDGPHSVVASAFLAPSGVPRGAAPTAWSSESPARAVTVDNPPLLAIELGKARIAPDLGQATEARLHLAPDAAANAGHLSVQLSGPGGATATLHDGTAAAGPLSLPVHGGLCVGGCPDGTYAVTARLTDARGRVAHAGATLVVDRLPPTSALDLPPVVNAQRMVGSNGISLAWTADDGIGAGVDAVRLLRLRADGTLLADLGSHAWPIQATDLFGVGHRDVLHFLTVAHDAVGHTESPCDPGEAAPCFRAKLRQVGAPQQVTLDYSAPSVSGLGASTPFIRPGSQTRFAVQAVDADSGLHEVRLRFSDGFDDVVLPPTAGALHEATLSARPLAPGEEPGERAFVYEAIATDRGGNQQVQSASGTLDSLAPRVTPLDTSYAGNENKSAALVGDLVAIRARVQDASVQAVATDLRAFGGPAARPCLPEATVPGVWRCEFPVPNGMPDGEHTVAWQATDAAGNVNATSVSRVRVSSDAPAITDVRVTDVRHDGFTLRWTTDVPAMSAVRHGRDNNTDGRALNLTCPAGLLEGRNCFRTQHAVDVRGLAPGTEYVAKALATGRSGLAREAPPVTVRTTSAYVLSMPDLAPGTTLTRTAEVALHVDLLQGDAPVRVQTSLQDAQERASPVPVADGQYGEGAHVVSFGTAQVPDGEYRVVLFASRSGDFLRLRSPVVRIDNTDPVVIPVEPAPDQRVADARPWLRVSALDPLGTAALATARLAIDDQPAAAEQAPASAWEAGAPQRMALRPAAALSDGVHVATVFVTDAAGNEGNTSWRFTVDTSPPTMPGKPAVAPESGLPAARPGGRVRVTANATDGAGVASGNVSLGGVAVPLLRDAAGRWTALATVPANATGPLPAVLSFTDALGNRGIAGTVTVPVDARVPQLSVATVRPGGFTTLVVEVQANEPVTLAAQAGGVAAASAARDARHTLVLMGLRPGAAHAVQVVASDVAGNEARVHLNATLPVDDEAPEAPRATAASPGEGEVLLQWTPVGDNAGVASIRVERSTSAGWVLLAELAANATRFHDREAPAAHAAEYRVTTVDVAGLSSPPTLVRVLVRAAPHLQAPEAEPKAGPAADPFRFRVLYRHASGHAPELAYVETGAVRIVLKPIDPAASCAEGCLLEGVGRLPAATLAGAVHPVFVAVAEGEEVRIPLGWTPRVTGESAALQATPAQEAPAASVPALLLIVLAALALRRSRKT